MTEDFLEPAIIHCVSEIEDGRSPEPGSLWTLFRMTSTTARFCVEQAWQRTRPVVPKGEQVQGRKNNIVVRTVGTRVKY